MNDFTQLTTILVLGIFFGAVANFLIKNTPIQLDKIKTIIKNNANFAEKQAAVEKMKADGDFHQWETIPTLQGQAMVCIKTGWSPTLQGFIPMSFINNYLENRKAEAEYKEFRSARVQLLAHQLQLSIPAMEDVVEKVFSMKKDFLLLRVSKLQQELQDKAAAVDNEQNKI